MSHSVSASTLEVASSSTRIVGSCARARAKASSCRCPTESRPPRSPTAAYSPCRLCPRACAVDRLSGALGFCREGPSMRIGAAGLHFGEEPPVTGRGGSGTVFFSGCNLRCTFCQNQDISREAVGIPVNAEGLAAISRFSLGAAR